MSEQRYPPCGASEKPSRKPLEPDVPEPAGGHAVLAADGLYKAYRQPHQRISVLQGAELCVRAGESVAIVGKSGAGKSTLLHVLGGLDGPDAGRVWVCGNDLYGLSAALRARVRAGDIGFVFQSYHLMPEMDLLENVMLPALASGSPLTRREARRRARELLEQVGLSRRATHMPAELSGGEQQRAALARALMNRPRLILADEPTGNLDRGTGGQTLDRLFELAHLDSLALLLVTHDPDVADRCDRRLRLEAGLLVPGDAAAQGD